MYELPLSTTKDKIKLSCVTKISLRVIETKLKRAHEHAISYFRKFSQTKIS